MSNLKSVAFTVLELLAFNSHDRPLRTHKQTNTHTSNERIISAIHFVHLALLKAAPIMSVMTDISVRGLSLGVSVALVHTHKAVG